MSLVGDALRKARREAAERDAERRGMLFSAHIADRPVRSNLGLGLVLGAVIAAAATVAGGAAVWWLLDRGSARSTADVEIADGFRETATATAETATSAAEATDGPPAPAADARDPTPPAARAADATALAQREPASDITAPAPASAAPDEPGPTSASPPATGRRSPSFAGMEDGDEVYILEADLGGTVLGLDFIVFRTTDPFAEINGIEVHLGGVVGGFRVKAIERDRVRLTDGSRTIVIRTP